MMDWCKGVEFYEKLANYHLRYAKFLAEKYRFNFSYDSGLLGLYKDKKQISNISYYKGDFNNEFYDCLLSKYGISRVQIENLIKILDTSDFSDDIVSEILDTFNYTNYDLNKLSLEYKETNKLNNKYRTFQNHVKDKTLIIDLNYEQFSFPTPLMHIKVKQFKIRCNIDGLGYENFSLYYKDLSLKPRELRLDNTVLYIPITDHAIDKNAKLISFDQRVIINLNEFQN